jgi:predicted DNA-binding protein with PD1-like motif
LSYSAAAQQGKVKFSTVEGVGSVADITAKVFAALA